MESKDPPIQLPNDRYVGIDEFLSHSTSNDQEGGRAQYINDIALLYDYEFKNEGDYNKLQDDEWGSIRGDDGSMFVGIRFDGNSDMNHLNVFILTLDNIIHNPEYFAYKAMVYVYYNVVTEQNVRNVHTQIGPTYGMFPQTDSIRLLPPALVNEAAPEMWNSWGSWNELMNWANHSIVSLYSTNQRTVRWAIRLNKLNAEQQAPYPIVCIGFWLERQSFTQNPDDDARLFTQQDHLLDAQGLRRALETRQQPHAQIKQSQDSSKQLHSTRKVDDNSTFKQGADAPTGPKMAMAKQDQQDVIDILIDGSFDTIDLTMDDDDTPIERPDFRKERKDKRAGKKSSRRQQAGPRQTKLVERSMHEKLKQSEQTRAKSRDKPSEKPLTKEDFHAVSTSDNTPDWVQRTPRPSTSKRTDAPAPSTSTESKFKQPKLTDPKGSRAHIETYSDSFGKGPTRPSNRELPVRGAINHEIPEISDAYAGNIHGEPAFNEDDNIGISSIKKRFRLEPIAKVINKYE